MMSAAKSAFFSAKNNSLLSLLDFALGLRSAKDRCSSSKLSTLSRQYFGEGLFGAQANIREVATDVDLQPLHREPFAGELAGTDTASPKEIKRCSTLR